MVHTELRNSKWEIPSTCWWAETKTVILWLVDAEKLVKKFVTLETRDDGSSIHETYMVVSFLIQGRPDCLVAVCGEVTEKDILSAAKIALW